MHVLGSNRPYFGANMIEPRAIEHNIENLRFVSERLAHIPHFIFFGTLLGYVRNRSIIPTDDDIDIYVEAKYLRKVERAFAGSELELSKRRSRRLGKNRNFKQGVRIQYGVETYADFYFYQKPLFKDYVVDHWNFSGHWRDDETDLHVPKSLLFPIMPAVMHGIDIKLPAQPEACCAYLYGEDWKTPQAKGSQYKMTIVDHKPKLVLL